MQCVFLLSSFFFFVFFLSGAVQKAGSAFTFGSAGHRSVDAGICLSASEYRFGDNSGRLELRRCAVDSPLPWYKLKLTPPLSAVNAREGSSADLSLLLLLLFDFLFAKHLPR